MATEYLAPMLDVGSARVFNCNVLTHQLQAANPAATPFFRNRQLNNLVLIKDNVPGGGGDKSSPGIGTKLYFPFNDNNIYEGGRTIFAHEKNLEAALGDMFGHDALGKEALAEDLRLLRIMDRMPTLDPFLLKDVFLNEGFTIDDTYFEVPKELWNEIQTFILKKFEPVVKAAFLDTESSNDRARMLIDKIWEARDLDALKPLIDAFRLPPNEALEIFAAWKGINFYLFQCNQIKPQFIQMLTWLRDLQLPAGIAIAERNEVKTSLENMKTQLRAEWQKVDNIIQAYQTAYDKMFTLKTSSLEFVTFLKNSRKVYWELGNSLGKIGQAAYCWNVMTKRHPERKVPWEPLREIIMLLEKIFQTGKQPSTVMAW